MLGSVDRRHGPSDAPFSPDRGGHPRMAPWPWAETPAAYDIVGTPSTQWVPDPWRRIMPV